MGSIHYNAIPKVLEPSDCLYYWTMILLNQLNLSLLIPVLEKDGSVCLVGDYRKLNEVTVPILFVMLYYTEEVCTKLDKAKILSKLDLMNGFNQVPCKP